MYQREGGSDFFSLSLNNFECPRMPPPPPTFLSIFLSEDTAAAGQATDMT